MERPMNIFWPLDLESRSRVREIRRSRRTFSPDMSGENSKCPAKGYKKEEIEQNVRRRNLLLFQLSVWMLKMSGGCFLFRRTKMSGEGFMVRRSKCPAKLKIISRTQGQDLTYDLDLRTWPIFFHLISMPKFKSVCLFVWLWEWYLLAA